MHSVRNKAQQRTRRALEGLGTWDTKYRGLLSAWEVWLCWGE